MEGRYEPINIEEVKDGILQGYSAVLNLLIRRDNGQLRWHDPGVRQEIPTFEGERSRADAAEARVQELEAELTRRNEET